MELEKFNRLKELFGLSDSEINNLLTKVKKLETTSINVFENNVEFLKSFGATDQDISFIALNGGISTFTCRAPQLTLITSTIKNLYNLSNEDIVQMYKNSSSPSFLYLTKEELIEKFDNIQRQTGLTDKHMKDLLTSSHSLKSEDFILSTIRKVNFIKKYTNLDSLYGNAEILNQGEEKLQLQFMLAVINNKPIDSFIEDKCYKLPVSKSYARTMAKLNGDINNCSTIFVSEKYFSLNYGFQTLDLMQKYPYDEKAKQIIINLYNEKVASLNTGTSTSSSPQKEKVKNFLELFKNNFGLSNNEIYNIIKTYPEVINCTQDLLNKRIILLINKYGFVYSDINRIAIQNPLLLTISDEKITQIYNQLTQSHKLTPEEFKQVMVSNKHLLACSLSDFEQYNKTLVDALNLSNDELKSLITKTTSYGYQQPREIKAKLKLLEICGIDREMLNGDLGILSGGYENLETKLKIALLTNTDLKSFSEIGYMTSVKKLYSRYKLLQDFNKTQELSPFTSHKEFYNQLGINPKEVENLHAYSITSSNEIDSEFKSKFLDLSEKFNIIRNYYLKTSDEIELISEQNTIEDNSSSTSALFSVLKENTTLTRDEITQIISIISDLNEITPEELSKKIKRFKRITQATNEDFSEFLLNYPNALTDSSNKALINISQLMEMGIPFSVSKNKQRVITLNPQKTRIRLILSRLCGMADSQFLNGLCTYDESNIYSKMCVLRSINEPTKYAYAKNDDFEKITGITISDCKEIFEYNKKIQEQLEENYNKLIARVEKENQGENPDESQ